MKKYFVFVLAALAAMASPAYAKKAPQLTPMELQGLQSKEFETTKDNLFGAVMTVLQDLGYQVQTADLQTGFVTAVSATQNKTNFLMALGGVAASGNTKVTCFLQSMPSGMTRVRLNFLNSRNTSSAYGQSSQDDKPILDVAVYHNAWEKIDEALFVMGALQAPAIKPAPAVSPVVPLPVPATPVAATPPIAPATVAGQIPAPHP
jgi:hypothetical protein